MRPLFANIFITCIILLPNPQLLYIYIYCKLIPGLGAQGKGPLTEELKLISEL